MPEVQDILEQYGEGYRQSHRLSMAQHKAMNAILNCRTAKLGGHMDNCPECGYQRPSYNSCRNRHCPKCQTLSKERWIAVRLHQNTALWFSVQSWQAEEAAHLQGTDGHITEKKRKALH